MVGPVELFFFNWNFFDFSIIEWVEIFLNFFSLLLPLLISIAFFTLVERKVMASIQRRKGPNVVGWVGLLQPFSDGLKLLLKESILPSNSNIGIFIFAPILTFFLSLIGWLIIPLNDKFVLVNLNVGLLYILAVSSLGVYGIIIAGWSSNSKYAFLGALRSAAQMISYEISMALILFPIIFISGSLNLNSIICSQEKYWFCFLFFPSFLMFLVSILAETNRTPFDLPEAEAELVSGYNVEYSAMGFALFFLAEYSNILLMSSLVVVFFLGGWILPFGINSLIPSFFSTAIKINFFVFFFIWVRATLPRYRYDQLMMLGWKCLLPLSLGYFLLIFGFILIFNGFCM